MKKKRAFSLIELFISLGLTAILLATLSFFFHQLNTMNATMDRMQEKRFSLSFVENRLFSVLTKTIWWNGKNNKKKQYFFTAEDPSGLFQEGSDNLIFLYDRGIDLDYTFSSHALGRLFVDRKGNLTLASWPEPRLWEEGITPPMKREVLMENVDNLSFRFFGAPQFKDEAEEEMLIHDWNSSWPAPYKQLPALIELTVKQGKTEHTFAFPLIEAKKIILYER